MPRLAYLTSPDMVPGRPPARADLHELVQQLDEVVPALSARGWSLSLEVWSDPDFDPSAFDAIVIGTTWDYHDHAESFLNTIVQMARTTPVLNEPELVSWNAKKSYLKELGEAGVPIVPTVWADPVDHGIIEQAHQTFGSDRLVIKSLVGACAQDQIQVRRGGSIPILPSGPTLVQPFLDAINTEGEYSFIYFGGQFSHALIKRPAEGDYRVQSVYGGTERPYIPTADERRAAADVIGALPRQPLYARVDLVRGPDDTLLLMEVELIEPFLYPLQGPGMGARFAEALVQRLG